MLQWRHACPCTAAYTTVQIGSAVAVEYLLYFNRCIPTEDAELAASLEDWLLQQCDTFLNKKRNGHTRIGEIDLALGKSYGWPVKIGHADDVKLWRSCFEGGYSRSHAAVAASSNLLSQRLATPSSTANGTLGLNSVSGVQEERESFSEVFVRALELLANSPSRLAKERKVMVNILDMGIRAAAKAGVLSYKALNSRRRIKKKADKLVSCACQHY